MAVEVPLSASSGGALAGGGALGVAAGGGAGSGLGVPLIDEPTPGSKEMKSLVPYVVV